MAWCSQRLQHTVTDALAWWHVSRMQCVDPCNIHICASFHECVLLETKGIRFYVSKWHYLHRWGWWSNVGFCRGCDGAFPKFSQASGGTCSCTWKIFQHAFQGHGWHAAELSHTGTSNSELRRSCLPHFTENASWQAFFAYLCWPHLVFTALLFMHFCLPHMCWPHLCLPHLLRRRPGDKIMIRNWCFAYHWSSLYFWALAHMPSSWYMVVLLHVQADYKHTCKYKRT